jgi:hypothetical protein
LKQANELAQALNSSEDNPSIVSCGDFNADADTPNPTLVATLNGRFIGVWPTLHPQDRGFNIPLYIEDIPSPPPFTAVSTPSQRIDLVFLRHLSATQIDLIGNQISPACQNRQKSMRKSMPFAML